MHRRLLVLAAALWLAESCSAANLVQNPSFDSDVSGWSGTPGSFGYVSNDGSPVAGSGGMGAGGSRGFGSIGQCVVVEALPPPWEIKERLRIVTVFLYINASFYPTLDCTGQLVIQTPMNLGSSVPGVQGDFDLYSLALTNDPMPGGLATKSVAIGVGAYTLANSVLVHIDSAYVGPPDTSPVTLTGFDVE